ncbi:MAG: hypothetical protein LBE50_03065 [Gallionellaceae bacterium]|jgi:prophage tail gpP-like protein|nr:hypothetical protein [Gallionellaceae bacterium]
MDEVLAELRFDGLRYDFWQKVSIRESVDDLCASVQLGLTRPGTDEALGLTANTVAEVLIDNALVSTVRADSLTRNTDATSTAIQLEARSLGRELVDCQYSQTLSGLTLAEIVKRLCGEFKVPVKIDAPTAVVPDFAMQCESPANAILNAARAANLLFYPTPEGGLILTTPSKAAPVATLRYGEHFTSYSIVDEFKLRFSEYFIKGYDYEGDSALSGRAKDSGIAFFRPMHIQADKHGQGLGGCERRAKMELDRRKARAHRIDLDIPGWRFQDASNAWQLWRINTQVRVIIPHEGVEGVFLIGDRAFQLDDQKGSTTSLQVMPRDAFMGEAK